MGRIKPATPDGHFIFKGKLNSKGERNLYLRYYLNGEDVLTATGIAIQPADWDNKKEQVRPRNTSYARLNNMLKKQRENADIIISEHKGKLTPSILKSILSGNYETAEDIKEKEKSQDFIQYALDFNQSSYNLEKLAYSTYNNDNYNIEKFRKYITKTRGEDALPLTELSVDIFDKYKEYCLETGNLKQSINKKLKPLFKAVEYASKNDLITSKLATSICDGYFNLKARKYEAEVEDGDINYLTEEQLQEFINLYYTVKYDRTREFIDIFMFSYYACGLRFSDLLTIEWKHIDWENKKINKNLFKGKIPHNIPLTDGALEILSRWKQKNYNERFIFNLLPDYFNLKDVALLDNQRKSKNRSLQTSLNELGKKLHLKFNLSIHVARHSYAVMALANEVSLHMISKLLGHSSIITTEKVYAKFLPATVNEAVMTKTNKVFRPVV